MNTDEMKQQWKDLNMKSEVDSLEACKILYNIKQRLLDTRNNNEQDKKYKKDLAALRKELNIKSSQLIKDSAVGRYLLDNTGSNELLSMNKTNIYNTYIRKKTTSTPKVKKPDPRDIEIAELKETNKTLAQKYMDLHARYKELLNA